jgi:ribonuclease P/MRP protein subunit POP5
MKFEHYKLAAGAPLSPDVNQHMQNCLEKINILEH